MDSPLQRSETDWKAGLIRHVLGGELIPVFNAEILDECQEVLHRKKFHFPEKAIDIVLGNLQEQGLSINAGKMDIDLPDE